MTVTGLRPVRSSGLGCDPLMGRRGDRSGPRRDPGRAGKEGNPVMRSTPQGRTTSGESQLRPSTPA